MANVSPTERTLDIIELLADYPEGLALTEIARRLNLPKSIAHRLLSVLAGRDFAVQDPVTQHYRLAIRTAALGLRFFGNIGLVDICQPIINRLAQRTGEFIRVSAAENGELVWIAKAQGSSNGLRYDPLLEPGPVLHATAHGRAWLATLEDTKAMALVRRRGFYVPTGYDRSLFSNEQELLEELARIRKLGYAISADESLIGMSAIGAAIPDRKHGSAVGAISVAGPSVRMTASRLEEVSDDLLAAARDLGDIWPIPRARIPAAAPT
ncbi:IclR family transcriptional regulator [Sinorhizobium meliloti]|uniref:IclR family transcriptional regulator n=1 Tax=Rhizobium meliloti TaxID=382 RepID=UPI000362FB1B|nr:IclR family transcriptional regulator [Sinorhizobium meliloti]MDE3878717.1 IclR family transcriptional regulator [Sinorhizobium meliloti]MDE4604600.1 IclR family transcriptional regulator [Sinorhizobium meliloti]MDX0315676.1 helix-turn-helix domain-containing protein [Sinorhizobium meliloti]RVH03943.1 IclR family transcriptional regulator [Sinorhizobium meliloti]UDU21160.1 IclR family transcriptional regulator [Sinorhizobium meliloti]